MIFPISTDHHDGKVGIISIVIIAICFLIQIAVTIDNHRVEKDIEGVIVAWKTFNETDSLIGEASDQVDELGRSVLATESLATKNGSGSTYGEMTAAYLASTSQRQEQLENSIDSVRQTSLMYRGALVKNNRSFFDLFTYMFIHAGWLHLIGNIWLFYITGIMMERYWGIAKFTFFYLLFGIFSGLGFFIISSLQGADVASTPLVGASGAISGMIGALWATGKHVNVKVAYYIGFRRGIFAIPMGWYLGVFLILQLIFALLLSKTSGVALLTPVTGFVLGLIFGHFIHGNTFEKKIEIPIKIAPKKSEISATPQVAENLQLSEPIAPISEGWKAFDQKQYDRAAEIIVAVMDNYLLDPIRFSKELTQEMEKIFISSKLLLISSEIYLTWAMTLQLNNLKIPALYSYELSAQFTKDLDSRLKSLLKTADLRIETGLDTPKAVKFLEYVIQHDSDGRFRREAEYHLARVKPV